jgi:hypothetical protein
VLHGGKETLGVDPAGKGLGTLATVRATVPSSPAISASSFDVCHSYLQVNASSGLTTFG